MKTKIKTILRIIFTTKNWFSVFLAKLGLKKNTNAIFRSDFKLNVSKENWKKFMNYVNFFRDFPEGKAKDDYVKINYKGNELRFHFGNRDRWGPNMITEVFSRNEYKKLLGNYDIRDKQVVDIGASIGDSAVFFAIEGAKKVYAFEPFPYFYKLARKNIKENNFQDVCEIFNKAVGENEDSISIDDDEEIMLGVYMDKEKGNKEIPVLTLERIVEDNNIENGVLKLDCEGYEYDIILSSKNETLNKFDFILMEYHYGPEKLAEKLKGAGFSVDYSEPQEPERQSKYMEDLGKIRLGYLTAKKIMK